MNVSQKTWWFHLFHACCLGKDLSSWFLYIQFFFKHLQNCTRPICQFVPRVQLFHKFMHVWFPRYRSLLPSLSSRQRYIPIVKNSSAKSPVQVFHSALVLNVVSFIYSTKFISVKPENPLWACYNFHRELTSHFPGLIPSTPGKNGIAALSNSFAGETYSTPLYCRLRQATKFPAY